MMKVNKPKRPKVVVFMLLLIFGGVLVNGITANLDIKPSIVQTSSPTSYYTKYGYHEYLGNNKFRFQAKLGMVNTFNGIEYVPYIWYENNKTAKYSDVYMQFNDWFTVFGNKSGVLIDDERWGVEYWQTQAGGRWATLDLWNHTSYAPQLFDKYMVYTQGYDDGFSFMNVSYHIDNYGTAKVTINFISGGDYLIRFNWKLTGIQGDFLDFDPDQRLFDFGNIFVSLNDTDKDRLVTYDWAVATKKLDCYISNYTVTTNDRIVIDPSFNTKLATDENDFYITYSAGAANDYITGTVVRVGPYYQPSLTNYSTSITWDTGISDTISSIGNSSWTYFLSTNNYGSGEYFGAGLYNYSSGYNFHWNETEIAADGGAGFRDQTTYYWNNSFYAPYGESGNISNPCDELLTAWANYHNNDTSGYQSIPVKFDSGTNSAYNSSIRLYESAGAVDTRMTLTFDWVNGTGATTTTTTTTTTTEEEAEPANGSHNIIYGPHRMNFFEFAFDASIWVMVNIWWILPPIILIAFITKILFSK